MNSGYNKLFFSHFLILNFLALFKALQEPGRLNPKYKIKNYYGSRYLETYLSSTFLNDDPTLVEWSTELFLHETDKNLLYLTVSKEHTIKLLDNKQEVFISGSENNPGFRNGDTRNALFNSPHGLVIYNLSSFPNEKEFTPNYVAFPFKNNNIECLYATKNNYTSCLNNTYKALTNDSKEVNRELIKLINFNTNIIPEYTKILRYIFIADTNNHCIRKIDLMTEAVSTYAGICGNPGFKDGPYEINKFNLPRGIGKDKYGNLFVYDSGNKYMRMIKPDGFVQTLIKGACFEYKMEDFEPNVYGVKVKKILCFRKWIKVEGEPSEHIYIESDQNLCYKHAVLCPGYKSDLSANQGIIDK